MTKYFLLSIFLGSFLFVGIVSAHEVVNENNQEIQSIAEAEAITVEDLGVKKAGLLPTSPFYFLKEFGRGIKKVFTFDSIKKLEAELQIANEKAAEAIAIGEKESGNEGAIKKALENYQKAHAKLQKRLESLKETSENPNVDRLLSQLTEKIVLHTKLFEELEGKFEKKEELRDLAHKVGEEVESTIEKTLEKDTQEKFRERIKNALEKAEGSKFGHIRSLEILDRLEEKISEDAKEQIKELREEFLKKTKETLEGVGEEDSKNLKEIFEHIPGDLVRRILTIGEIGLDASKKLKEDLQEVIKDFKERVEKHEDVGEKAREQIEKAGEKIMKLEERIKGAADVSAAVLEHLRGAKDHLQKAKEALEQQKFGEAFGQATSGESLARNGLRLLDNEEDLEEEEELEEIEEKLKELEEEIHGYEEFLQTNMRIGKLDPKAEELLSNAKKHFGFAREAFSKHDIAGTNLHIGHVKGFLDDLEDVLKTPVSRVPTPEPIFCTMEYNPVCGVDGKTYSNRCVAEQQNKVRVSYEGECRKEDCRIYKACDLMTGAIGEFNSCGPAPLPTWTTVLSACEVKPTPTPIPTSTPQPTPVPSPVSITPSLRSVTIKADDTMFSPSEIRVAKGAKVSLTFNVSETNVYYAGLDFRSSKFDTGKIAPGGQTTVEFTTDESFEFKSYWPSSGVLKATGRVIVE